MAKKKKNWKKIGLVVLGAYLAVAGILNVVGNMNEKKEAEQKAQQLAIAEKKIKDRWLARIDNHHQTLSTSIEEGKLAQAEILLAQFKKYGQTNYKNVPDLAKTSTALKLEAETLKLPKDQLDEMVANYKKMTALAPDNKKWQKRRSDLETRKAARDKNRAEAEKAYRTLVAKFGEKPKNSGWDSSVRCVKKYLESTAKDPESLKYEKWGKVSHNKEDGWVVWCEWRGKNSFGGYVRNANWFVIRHGQVVAMKDLGAYTL